MFLVWEWFFQLSPLVDSDKPFKQIRICVTISYIRPDQPEGKKEDSKGAHMLRRDCQEADGET